MEGISKKDVDGYCIHGKRTNRCLYSFPLARLNSLGVVTWSGNRDLNEDRVGEIEEYIKTEKRVVGIIYLAELNGQLVCFDGNHRRHALKEISPKQKVDDILVMIMWGAEEEDVVSEFKTINLSEAVSSIHLDGGMSAKDKVVISTYVRGLKRDYPSLCKDTKCIRPHFSGDKLEQDIYELRAENEDLQVDDIIEILKLLNKLYKKGSIDHGPITDSINKKCTQTGMWLFCKGRTINRHDFSRARGKYLKK